MGGAAAYMIGISKTGEAYMCFAPTQPGRDPVFERRQWMDNSGIVARLLEGRQPDDITKGAMWTQAWATGAKRLAPWTS